MRSSRSKIVRITSLATSMADQGMGLFGHLDIHGSLEALSWNFTLGNYRHPKNGLSEYRSPHFGSDMSRL